MRPLKIGNIVVISRRTLLDMWLIINAGLKVNKQGKVAPGLFDKQYGKKEWNTTNFNTSTRGDWPQN